jgi:hypothetical protein
MMPSNEVFQPDFRRGSGELVPDIQQRRDLLSSAKAAAEVATYKMYGNRLFPEQSPITYADALPANVTPIDTYRQQPDVTTDAWREQYTELARQQVNEVNQNAA